MRVTVLIAAYNAEASIAEAVESALSQNPPAGGHEVLVVDDGSTDRTRGVLARFGGSLRVLDQPHRGLAAALNAGLAAAGGEGFLRLDADDTLAPGALQALAGGLAATPAAGCAYADRIEVFPDGRTERISLAAFNVFRTIGCGILFRTGTARAIGGYDDLLFEEYDFLIRYLMASPERVYVPEALYRYRRHAAGMTGRPRYWEEGMAQMRRKWGEAALARWGYHEVFACA